jgi:hypothetical protein
VVAGVDQGVEAAAALRALAGDQLRQLAGSSNVDDGMRRGDAVTSTAGGIDAAEARLLEIRERYASPYPQHFQNAHTRATLARHVSLEALVDGAGMLCGGLCCLCKATGEQEQGDMASVGLAMLVRVCCCDEVAWLAARRAAGAATDLAVV